uniref:Galectin 9C n=1 Tax=Homo sapiens TaxID=9606 RepID=J3QKS2_HUMAN
MAFSGCQAPYLSPVCCGLSDGLQWKRHCLPLQPSV